jgi:hypothetical protein
MRSFSLDARLAAGDDPARSPLLAAQVANLTDPRRRELLATALGGLVVAAGDRPRISRLSPSRSAVLRNEAALLELARRVDSQEALYARGLARLELLLIDASGPAFHGGPAHLAAELERIELELGGFASGEPAPPSASGDARGHAVRRLARMRRGSGRPVAPAPPGFVGGSFALPDGSWFHGRRES